MKPSLGELLEGGLSGIVGSLERLVNGAVSEMRLFVRPGGWVDSTVQDEEHIMYHAMHPNVLQAAGLDAREQRGSHPRALPMSLNVRKHVAKDSQVGCQNTLVEFELHLLQQVQRAYVREKIQLR